MLLFGANFFEEAILLASVLQIASYYCRHLRVGLCSRIQGKARVNIVAVNVCASFRRLAYTCEVVVKVCLDQIIQ